MIKQWAITSWSRNRITFPAGTLFNVLGQSKFFKNGPLFEWVNIWGKFQWASAPLSLVNNFHLKCSQNWKVVLEFEKGQFLPSLIWSKTVERCRKRSLNSWSWWIRSLDYHTQILELLHHPTITIKATRGDHISTHMRRQYLEIQYVILILSTSSLKPNL